MKWFFHCERKNQAGRKWIAADLFVHDHPDAPASAMVAHEMYLEEHMARELRAVMEAGCKAVGGEVYFLDAGDGDDDA